MASLPVLGLVALAFGRLAWRLYRLTISPSFRLGENLRALSFDLALFFLISECLSHIP